jgi:hypothetical protein
MLSADAESLPTHKSAAAATIAVLVARREPQRRQNDGAGEDGSPVPPGDLAGQ